MSKESKGHETEKDEGVHAKSFKNRKLYLNKEDEKVSGVASGLAEYIGVDVTLVRLVIVAFGLRNPLGTLILYWIASWVMPEKHYEDGKNPKSYYEDSSEECQWENSSKVNAKDKATETPESESTSYYTEQEEYDLEDIQPEEEGKAPRGSYLVEVDDARGKEDGTA